MYRLLFFSFCLAFLPMILLAQAPTYADDVAELIYTHCGSCHRAGEIGPMPLTNYDEVKSWANMIQYVTETKYMPPWQPDPAYSRFRGENFLTDEQIEVISDWVNAGMPRGDVSKEPPFPSFPTGSVLGTPDLVLEMAEDYLHKGNGEDQYVYFVLPSGLTEDKIVKAVEFRPGNTAIVHHALIFEDLTGEAARRDALTPEYGFDGFGGFNNQQGQEKQFPGYVPGQKPILFPDGIGQTMKAGSDIVIQVHYAPWPVDEYDRSKVNIFFADEDEEVEREVQNHIMLPLRQTIGEAFVIAPGTVQEFHGKFTVPIPVSLLGVFPHMHLLGRHWEIYLEKKDGTKVNMCRINDWDFNWQGGYYFDRYIVAEPGDVIHAIASYDNTRDNPNNPNDPPNWVSWGEKTTDEMYYLPISYVPYMSGDEDVIFTDVTTSDDVTIALGQSAVTSIRPNPVTDLMVADLYLARGASFNVDLIDGQGRLIRRVKDGEFFNIGRHSINVNTRPLGPGVYFLRITSDEVQLNQRFVKH
jgi:hypothetical protein